MRSRTMELQNGNVKKIREVKTNEIKKKRKRKNVKETFFEQEFG